MKPKLFNTIGILFLQIFIINIAFADFSLVCPPDVTVSCREDYLHDLNVFGRAYTDYNGVIQYQHDCKTIIEIDDCGKGTIKRVWGIENPENWKWLTCTQIITISNANGFRYEDIIWPLSLQIRSCNPQADIKNLQAPYDEPSWIRPKCAKPMVSYKDTRFKVDEGCEKILREWKVLDWCQYDPILYPGRGIFSYTQVIKLISVSDSVNLFCKQDTIVLNNKNCDSIYVNLDSAIFQSACQIYYRIYNTSKYALHPGANASGYYPNGITKFYYIAEYACGMEVKCEVIVDVRNKIQPTPYCLTGVILALMPFDTDNDGVIDDGMVEVWASDLDKGSWHKCPGQKLNFSFSKDVLDRFRIFTCKDVGTNEVEIWVTDSLGNQDVCKTNIEIQNNNTNIPNCDGNLQGGKKSISGKIVFFNTTPPSKLNVTIYKNGSQSSHEADKNNNYQYQFTDLEPNKPYNIQTDCQYFAAPDLDYDDLGYLKKLVDGKIKLTSPYILLAADVNQDHEINQLDYNILKQVIYFRRFDLLVSKWMFLPESFAFTNPSNPLHEVMPLGIDVLKLDHDMVNQNFIAIRIGDLVKKVSKDSNWEIRNKVNSESQNFTLLECKVNSQANKTSTISWKINSTSSQNINMELITLDGKKILSKVLMLGEGIQEYTTEISASGMLLFILHNPTTSICNKLVIN